MTDSPPKSGLCFTIPCTIGIMLESQKQPNGKLMDTRTPLYKKQTKRFMNWMALGIEY
jgi:hypothetical protein